MPLENLISILLEEISSRFSMVTDAEGNVFPQWPTPQEVKNATIARLAVPQPEN